MSEVTRFFLLQLTFIAVVLVLAGTCWAEEIVSWGDNLYSQVSDTPTGKTFVAIAGGAWHSLALISDGSIVSWGGDR